MLIDASKFGLATGNRRGAELAKAELDLKALDQTIAQRSAIDGGPLSAGDPDIQRRLALQADIARLRSDIRTPLEGRSEEAKALLASSKTIRQTYDVVAGRQSEMAPDGFWSPLFVRMLANARAWIGMARLGGAPLSSLGDMGTLNVTARFNGLSGTKTLARYLKALAPGSAEDRAFASRSGLIAEEALRLAGSAQRFQDDISDQALSRMSEAFHRLTGLTRMTHAGKVAFGMEFMAALGDHVGKPLAQMAAPLRDAVRRSGVTDQAWSALRRDHLTLYHDSTFLIPASLADDPALGKTAQRLQELILQETDYAIPEPDARIQAVWTAQPANTIMGQVVRTLTMFKSFPLTVMFVHGARAAEAKGGAGFISTRAGYAINTLLLTTLFGATAIQAKQIRDGKDPRSMRDSAFWAEAFFQGGGLGIFGDFIRSATDRTNKSLIDMLMGPVQGFFANDLFRLTSQNVRQFYDGVPTRFSGELVRFAQNNTPFLNIWYAKTAFDRLLWSRLYELAEPQAAAVWARQQAKALKDYGQRYFWSPADPLPNRAPDIAAAVGGK